MSHGLSPAAAAAAETLCERIRQIIAPQITSEFAFYSAGEDKTFARRVCNARSVLVSHTHLSPEEQARRADALDRYLESPLEDYGSLVVDFMQMATIAVTQAVTAAWVAGIRVGLTEAGGQMWLRLDILDEVMLPRGNEVSRQRCADAVEHYAQGAVTADEAFGFLRQVRASLPVGEVLPEEAVQFLEANDVVVVR